MQNEFVALLNKYLTGQIWLKARPKSLELEDRFYFKVVKPLAELIDSAPEALKADFKAVLRACNKLSITNVVFVAKKGNSLPNRGVINETD